MINDLDYEGIKFPVSKKDYCRIEKQNNICINVFCYENNLTDPVYISDKKFPNSMDLLLISDENKSHYAYIKDFNRFTRNKTKKKIKNIFENVVYSIEHGENCLIINDKQSVSISFKNYFKQFPVPFKIYTDFEYILKRVRGSHRNNGSYTEKYQGHIPRSFAYKVVCVDNKFSKKVVLYRGENAVHRFTKATLEEYDYCKKIIKTILIRILSCLQKKKNDFN